MVNSKACQLNRKRIAFILVPALALLILFATRTAAALEILISNVTTGVDIVDGGPGDLLPLVPGTIAFAQAIRPGGPGGFIVSGVLSEVIVPGVSATLTLTDLFVISTAPFVTADIIGFLSTAFAPVGPPTVATAHLDGSYITTDPTGLISFADVVFTGRVNPRPGMRIGNILDPPSVGPGVAAPVAFGPLDTNQIFPFGVTQLAGLLAFDFSLARAGDGIFLPGSASVSVSVGEPSSVGLLGIGVGNLLLYGIWRTHTKVHGRNNSETSAS